MILHASRMCRRRGYPQTHDPSGATFDCTVTAAGPLPYGFAFWGDYTGQTISVNAPP